MLRWIQVLTFRLLCEIYRDRDSDWLVHYNTIHYDTIHYIKYDLKWKKTLELETEKNGITEETKCDFSNVVYGWSMVRDRNMSEMDFHMRYNDSKLLRANKKPVRVFRDLDSWLENSAEKEELKFLVELCRERTDTQSWRRWKRYSKLHSNIIRQKKNSIFQWFEDMKVVREWQRLIWRGRWLDNVSVTEISK